MNSLQRGCFKVIALLFLFQRSLSKPVKNESCEYDLDLRGNNIRVICHGKSAMVNIFASNAELKEGEMPSASKKGMEPQRDSADHPKPYHVIDYRFVTPMSEIVWNTTKKMERLKRKLSRHSAAMANISVRLAAGDESLRADLENMSRMKYDSVALKTSMLAAIQNQYNYMRTSILTQNAELSKMMDSLQMMTDLTSKSLQSAARSEVELFSQIVQVNKTMLTMRRMLSKELNKKRHRPTRGKNEKDKCPQQIMAIGSGDVINVKGKRGTFMKDVADDTSTVFIMQGAGASDRLVEYESEIDLEYSYIAITFNLPFKCQGTGHVVYQGSLYCQRKGTSKVIKYKLGRMETLGELDIHQKAGGGNEDNSNISFAVDEFGLWAIYSSPESVGKIMISKINVASFTIENTWLTSYPQSLAGNTFMICGVMYAIESFKESPTYIKYLFDTSTAKDVVLKEGTLVFPALDDANVDMATLAYNHKDAVLYGWGGSKIYKFHVFLEEGSRTK